MRRIRKQLSLTVLVTLSSFFSMAAAAPRALTLREANRNIELALEAEIAGDFAGARSELEARLKAATLPEESAGRARIEAWLRGARERENAFNAHGRTARAYLAALESLEPFGLERTNLWWSRAERDVPGLKSRFNEVALLRLRIDEVAPAELRGAVSQYLVPELARFGVRSLEAEKDGLELRLVLDARETFEVSGGVRVGAHASAFLVRAREPGRDAEVVGTIARRRTETRRAEERARAFAARRALADVAGGLVCWFRIETLRTLAEDL